MPAHTGFRSPAETWMRSPVVQRDEEIQYYEEIFEFVLQDLEKLSDKKAIITEGAAYLPQLMNKIGIPQSRYLAITPSAEFQISHYRQRDWIHYILDECTDKETAFDNWMQRDILFAEHVTAMCREHDYFSILNDGSASIDDLISAVSSHFGLKRT